MAAAYSGRNSLLEWSSKDVRNWLEAMGFGRASLEEVEAQNLSGASLVSLVNQKGSLESIGAGRLQAQQLVWNMQRRVEVKGDKKLGAALDLRKFQVAAGGKTKESSGSVGGKTKKKVSGQRAKQFNLIDLGDEPDSAASEQNDIIEEGEEEEEEEEEEDEDTEDFNQEQDRISAPAPAEFEVVFSARDPPNILLQEFLPGHRLSVKGFTRSADGSQGAAERCGEIQKGDFVIAANGILLDGIRFRESIKLIRTQKRPLTLRFQRVPKHLIHHNFTAWSTNGLRTILEEEGVELTGMEKHAQLANMARRTFWNKPVPLPPTPPQVREGATSIVNGETSICGWLVVKGPRDVSSRRMFCDLHGSELLFHEPCRDANESEDSSGGGSYERSPYEAVDMNRIAIVEHTRISEEGTKDLRLVEEDGPVWLLSANTDETLRKWRRQLLTAQIIGPGSRTSGQAEPSIPFIVSRNHNSLTVTWLPPRQPTLSKVHSFQVEYKKAFNPFSRWVRASDEVHSTRLVIKGLELNERYIVRVRAAFTRGEIQGKNYYGEWSPESDSIKTLSSMNIKAGPKEHLWILVHDLRGDPDDMRFVKGHLEARCGPNHEFLVSTSSGGALETLDGIDRVGRRLFEEVVLRVEAMRTLRSINFVCHGVGGLFARYALHLMDERGILGVNVRGGIFATFGTPHLGSTTLSHGVAGSLFGDDDTVDQLRFRDGNGGEKAILLRMCSPDYTSSLFQFEKRIAYANVAGGDVEHVSSSVRSVDPFTGMSATQLEPMVSKQYGKILNVLADIRADTPPDPARMKLETAAGPPGMWMEAAEALSALGWDRVDVFNTGIRPHEDLLVTSPRLTKVGESIVRHFVDSLFGQGGMESLT